MEDNEKGNNQLKITVFIILLISVLLLVFLLASGKLRFGLLPQFTYILYSICGFLAAILCFGILSSSGEINNNENGRAIKLSGAVVAFIVVAGGGGLYEKYFHTDPYFDLRIIFYKDVPTKSINIKGEVSILIGNDKRTEILNSSSTILFQHIPQSYKNQVLLLDLKGDFEIDTSLVLPLMDEKSLYIKVKPNSPFEIPDLSNVEINFAKAMLVNFGPKPDKYSLTVVFNLTSKSDKIIPISSKTFLELFDSGGNSVYSQRYDLDDTPRINSYETKKIYIDVIIPKNTIRLLKSQKGKVTFFYDNNKIKIPKEFSQDFTFIPEKI